jgi:hypothetical protein
LLEFGCPFRRVHRSPEQASDTSTSASSSCTSATARRHLLVAGTPPVSGSRDGLLHPPSTVPAEIRGSPVLLAAGEQIPQTPSPLSLDLPPHGRHTRTGAVNLEWPGALSAAVAFTKKTTKLYTQKRLYVDKIRQGHFAFRSTSFPQTKTL